MKKKIKLRKAPASTTAGPSTSPGATTTKGPTTTKKPTTTKAVTTTTKPLGACGQFTVSGEVPDIFGNSGTYRKTGETLNGLPVWKRINGDDR